MRKVVRAAYSGKCRGSSESGDTSSWVSGANKPARGLAQERDQPDHDDECQHIPARGEVAQKDVRFEAIHARILSGQATK